MARKRAEPQSRRPKSNVAGLTPGQAQAAPDEIKLNAISAARLASLAGLEVNEVQGQTIAAIAEQLKWAIDPEWLLFRRVCGRVVKTDPDTGISYPVPYATVHVLDTDCDFWGYFPEGWLYSWLFPIRCRTEELTKVVTDECGNFCVWIPRFEIDWILRWRRERFCYEEFLLKPSIADLLARLAQEVEIQPKFPPPNPGDPVELAAAVAERGDLVEAIGRPAQQAILAASRATAVRRPGDPARRPACRAGVPAGARAAAAAHAQGAVHRGRPRGAGRPHQGREPGARGHRPRALGRAVPALLRPLGARVGADLRGAGHQLRGDAGRRRRRHRRRDLPELLRHLVWRCRSVRDDRGIADRGLAQLPALRPVAAMRRGRRGDPAGGPDADRDGADVLRRVERLRRPSQQAAPERSVRDGPVEPVDCTVLRRARAVRLRPRQECRLLPHPRRNRGGQRNPDTGSRRVRSRGAAVRELEARALGAGLPAAHGQPGSSRAGTRSSRTPTIGSQSTCCSTGSRGRWACGS